jgi:protein phosphatase
MENDNRPEEFGPDIWVAGPEGFPPPSATVKVTFGAATRCGLSHAANGDQYVIVELGRHQKTLMTTLPDDLIAERFDEYGFVMVMADGMGDGGRGETASRLALTTLMQLVVHFGKWNLRIDQEIAREVMARAARFYRHVDSTMVHRRQVSGLPHLQTTLTAAFNAGRDLFFAHVGHSRAYLFREGHLMRLTRDHTIAQGRPAAGGVASLIDVNTAVRDSKHVLTETIGMAGIMGPTIDLERFQLEDNDRVLVCTNGLTDMVDETVIASVLDSEGSPEVQCQKLADLATAAGGEDDVTAVLARYRIPEAADGPSR